MPKLALPQITSEKDDGERERGREGEKSRALKMYD